MFREKFLFGAFLLVSFWGCSQDETSVAPGENEPAEISDTAPDMSLRDAYLELACKTSGSHVQLYNLENYGSVYSESLDEFFVSP